MKKNYLFMGLLVASATILGQNTDAELLKERTLPTGKSVKNAVPATNKATVIWSNDLSDPSDWTLTNTSSPAQDWVFTTDLSIIPVPTLTPAGFTTATNGYAIIDSDGAGSGAAQNSDLTADTLIDLTTISSVGLRFQQSYRTFEDRRVARVSNDAGVTWTEFVITEGLTLKQIKILIIQMWLL